MVYCAKCGKENDEDATFCKNCGASLKGYDYRKDREQRCEDECAGGKNNKGWAIFWGVIIVLIGLAILFELVLKQMADTYSWLSWVNTVQWNWIFAAVISIFIIIFGLRVISRK
ncbi:hypothetical protein AYK25_06670 [Thermoplasmatales archaeon SM1-50]|nr:MAG: hypothetical protein AYK25_06670 [Thermoplasmatales archaeon SM1-50]